MCMLCNTLYDEEYNFRHTFRPFSYDLNQIPYEYTVDMTNRFKGSDLMECLKNYGWRFVTSYRRQGSRQSPRKRHGKKNQIVVWRGLTNSSEEKRSERQRKKGKIGPFDCRVPRIARRGKKALLSDQCKGIEENNRMGKTRDLFKKIIPKEQFMQRWAQ